MDNKKMFEEYALLKYEIKEREEKIEKLKTLLLDIAVNEGIPETEIGIFSVRLNNRYEYSTEVTSLEEKLKDQKKLEVDGGIAKVISTPVLFCK